MSKRPSIFMGGSNAKTEAQARINFGLGPANNVVHEQLIANTVGISKDGALIGDGRYANLNFSGSGIASITDNNFGNVDIVISGGSGDTIDDGTAGDPGLIYTTEADMGLWKPASNTIGFAVAGTSKWHIDSVALFPIINAAVDLGTSTNLVNNIFANTITLGTGTGDGEISGNISFTNGLFVEFNELLLQNAEIKDYSITSNIITAISADQNLYLEYNEGPDFQVLVTGDISNLQVNNWPSNSILGKISVEFRQDTAGGNFVDFSGSNTDTIFEASTLPIMPQTSNADLEVVIWSRNAGANTKIAEIGQIFV